MCSNLELLEHKKFYQELDERDQEIIDISEASPGKVNTASIKSKVSPIKDITLQVKISGNVKEI